MSASVIILFCVIACPLSMALMMLFMRKGHGSSHSSRADDKKKIGDGDAG
jgi:hypothetical protein